MACNWKLQYSGKVFLSHEANQRKGVAIVESRKLGFDARSVICNLDGRYVLVDAMIQGSPFLLSNIYAPNR